MPARKRPICKDIIADRKDRLLHDLCFLDFLQSCFIETLFTFSLVYFICLLTMSDCGYTHIAGGLAFNCLDTTNDNKMLVKTCEWSCRQHLKKWQIIFVQHFIYYTLVMVLSNHFWLLFRPGVLKLGSGDPQEPSRSF